MKNFKYKIVMRDPNLRIIEIELGNITSLLGIIANSVHKIQVRGF